MVDGENIIGLLGQIENTGDNTKLVRQIASQMNTLREKKGINFFLDVAQTQDSYNRPTNSLIQNAYLLAEPSVGLENGVGTRIYYILTDRGDVIGVQFADVEKRPTQLEMDFRGELQRCVRIGKEARETQQGIRLTDYRENVDGRPQEVVKLTIGKGSLAVAAGVGSRTITNHMASESPFKIVMNADVVGLRTAMNTSLAQIR
ncbi:hypothetical protein A2866_06650 [Candidatus Roizmanbacteria bacterium RIFCSPHIGHO2_01_FULL_39_8]|uniref:Uncharacterized protein n=2 Tax=Candidatus Roizmaniibacteriota TaxID=1752723 RepID=A0A1F7GJS2_9BACT|nr:MAG: hypothetical protein A2866_06650 [Candidatus Roizmanbacteria bacterium RIFCSPHIGHO2_01_FULL_39_8]OGK34971.1 MAG: hypothetical protein A3F60_04865 [Candidatus Roizmanbacteria bacterium RIFCSPHIGHO2_12_FULL_39_8]